MAELEEMPGRELAARDVVDDQVGESRMRTVHEHARNAGPSEPLHLVVVGDHRDHEQPVGAVRPAEDVEGAAAAVLRLDVDQREVVGGRGEDLDDPAQPHDGGRARQERHDHPDHERPSEREVPGEGARAVLELLDRRLDARPGRRRDVRAAVQDTRDRCHADARARGDVPNAHRGLRNRFHSAYRFSFATPGQLLDTAARGYVGSPSTGD